MLKRITSRFRGDTYQARALRGSAVTVARLFGQNVIRLGSNLILTRLLFPEAFGLMALVTVVLVAAANFSDVGINSAILQHKRGHDPAFLNVAWTVQICRGTVLWLAIIVLAEPMATFYDAPELANLLLLGAFAPLIQGFNSTRLATARREIQLERLVVLELGAQLLGTLVMIVLAFWLRSVWGLLIGTLVSPLIIATLSHVVLKGVPNRLAFEREAFSSIMGFGKYIFFATIAGFFVTQGDRAILGKFVPLDDLAIYNIGFFLATVPALLSSTISWNVIYPLYARRPPAENESNRKKINMARIMLTAGLLVAITLLAITGDWLIRLMYDVRYEAAGPILVVVALGSMPQAIIQSYETMPLANGHSGRFAVYTITRACVLIGCLLASIPTFGLWGAALSPAVAVVLIYPVLVWAIAPYKGWDPRHDTVFAIMALICATAVAWLHADLLWAVLPVF